MVLEWTQYESAIRAPLECDSVYIFFDTQSTEISFTIDDVELRRSDALPRITQYGSAWKNAEYYRLAFDDVDGALYVGTYRGTTTIGGLFRTTDGGAHWDHVVRSDNIRGRPKVWDALDTWGLDVQHTVGQDPVVYFSNGYLYKSADDGVTWDNMCWDSLGVSYFSHHGEIHPVFVYDIAENCDIPEHLYYGDADNYLNISHDYGETWHRIGRDFFKSGAADWYDDKGGIAVKGDAVTSIVMDPVLSGEMYCGLYIHKIFDPQATGYEDHGGVV
jgi:hypothetical protein